MSAANSHDQAAARWAGLMKKKPDGIFDGHRGPGDIILNYFAREAAKVLQR
jgi:hypothetical protein